MRTRRRRGKIRSHRFKRRRVLASWIVVTGTLALVATITSFGFYLLVRQTCSGKLTTTVLAAPGTASLLQNAARVWTSEQHPVAGTCAAIEIESKDSAAVAQMLTSTWDTKSAGAAPDVWIPEASVWLRRAALNPEVAKMLPDNPTALARTPSVIAMPKPMGQALGWPKSDLTWQRLLTELAPAPDGWGKSQKPEWGPVRIAMASPAKSTAGLLALLSIADPDDAGMASPAGQDAIAQLKQGPVVSKNVITKNSVDEITADLTKADKQGPTAPLSYLSAFPALETDVYAYNQYNPVVPLVAFYPGGTPDADNPYVVLKAPWADPGRQQAATEFLKYLQKSSAWKPFAEAGYRDSGRGSTSYLTEGNGLQPTPRPPVKATPTPAALDRTLLGWTS